MPKFFLFFFLIFLNSYAGEIDVFDVINQDQTVILNSSEPEQEEVDLNDEKKAQSLNNEPSHQSDNPNSFNMASLRILNKITAKTFTIDAKTNLFINYDNIEMKIKSCLKQKNSKNYQALIYISGKNKNKPFNGWIFSNDQGILVFEHPIYNVSLIKCQ